MQLVLDNEALKPLIRAIVAEVTTTIGPTGANRLAYTEPEAAAALGIRPHQLRDARLRGEIRSTRLGGRIGYTTTALQAYLAKGEE